LTFHNAIKVAIKKKQLIILDEFLKSTIYSLHEHFWDLRLILSKLQELGLMASNSLQFLAPGLGLAQK